MIMLPISSATYFIKNNKTMIAYWINGERYEVEAFPQPYCFVKTIDCTNINRKYEKTSLKTLDTDQNVSLFEFNKPIDVKSFRTRLENRGILTYESDIRFVNRWMIDNKIVCNNYNKAYFDTEEDDSKELPNPETGNVPIISIAVTYNKQTTVFTGNEKDILHSFIDFIDTNKISLLCGWNSFNWDMPFIYKRMHYNGINEPLTKYRFLDLMLWYKYTTHSSRYSLEYIAKKEFNIEKPYTDQKIGLLNTEQLKERNAWDANMTYEIDNKLGLSNLAITIAQMSYLFPDNVLGIKKDREGLKATATPAIDNLYLSRAREIGYVLPPKTFNDRLKYPGAFVYQPIHGIYHNVLQFDVESLYPNVLIAFGYAPYGKTELVVPIVQQFLNGKKHAKNKYEYWAYKVLANIVYGAMASKYSRLKADDVAAKIAAKGKEIITSVIDLLNTMGYEIIFSDTDSVFVKCDISFKDELQDLINEYIKKKFNVNNINMRFEAYWSTIGFPRSDKEKTPKKRYFGIIKYDKELKEVNKFEIKGLEQVRGDWSNFAKMIQEEVMKMLVLNKPKEEILSYINEKIENMYKGYYDNELILTKHLTKNVEDYKVKPPHVKAYLDAKAQGWIPPEILQYNIIKYYITKGNIPKLVTLVKPNEIDYDYYYKRQIQPLLYRIGLIDEISKYKPSKQRNEALSRWF